ncbi:MAG TPA: hypothetical protein DCX75_17460 [Brevundimonas sp.]|nr:hypothetical protein [Brevundimonas sp.]HAJ04425.1 hypothetical protein [Brevundimonas sp.]HAV51719.1 hypothetical protein [Brevundimonas sp.]
MRAVSRLHLPVVTGTATMPAIFRESFMRILAALALCLGLLMAAPAMAQDGDAARRLQLAEQYVELSLGENIAALVGQLVEEDLAESPDMSDRERQWMRANMPPMILEVIDRMARDMAPVYAETFTLEELEALVAFYSTPLGQSVAIKEFELGARIDELLGGAMIQFFETFEAKYCAEFDCEPLMAVVPSAK